MIAEVSTRGRERLQRKLSLDVHLFPSIIKDKKRCKQMTAMALDLAGQHGCKIELPSQEPAPGTPRSEKATPKKAAPETPASETWNWRAWFGSLFGFAPTRIRLEDEESRAEGELRKELNRL
jgi:hypothetical protein